MKRLFTHSEGMMTVLFLGLVIVASGICFSASKAGQLNVENRKVFNVFAEELLDGMYAAQVTDVTARSGYGRASVIILPFQTNRIHQKNLTRGVVQELNSYLLSELIKQAQGRFIFLAPKRFRIPDRGEGACFGDCIHKGSVPTRTSGADIVITGTLRVRGDQAILSYKATGAELGTIFAATTPAKIHLNFRRHVKMSYEQRRRPIIHESVIFEKEDPSENQHVTFLQMALSRLGYRPGPINGQLSPDTIDAIKAYQWHHNLPATGHYTSSLMEHIQNQLSNG